MRKGKFHYDAEDPLGLAKAPQGRLDVSRLRKRSPRSRRLRPVDNTAQSHTAAIEGFSQAPTAPTAAWSPPIAGMQGALASSSPNQMGARDSRGDVQLLDVSRGAQLQAGLHMERLAVEFTQTLKAGDFVERSKNRWKSRNERKPDFLLIREKQQEIAVRIIQRAGRVYLRRKRLCRFWDEFLCVLMNKAAIRIQKHARGWVCRQIYNRLYVAANLYKSALKWCFHRNAVRIQCWYRRHLINRRIVHTCRHTVAKYYFSRLRNGVVPQLAQKIYLRRSDSAIILQRNFRWYLIRLKASRATRERLENSAARKIQQKWRRHRFWRQIEYERRDHAATIIQCAERCRTARVICQARRISSVSVRYVEQIVSTSLALSIKRLRELAATIIQRVRRGQLGRRRIQRLILQREERQRRRCSDRAYSSFAAQDMRQAALYFQLMYHAGFVGDATFWRRSAVANYKAWKAMGDRYNLRAAMSSFRCALEFEQNLRDLEFHFLSVKCSSFCHLHDRAISASDLFLHTFGYYCQGGEADSSTDVETQEETLVEMENRPKTMSKPKEEIDGASNKEIFGKVLFIKAMHLAEAERYKDAVEALKSCKECVPTDLSESDIEWLRAFTIWRWANNLKTDFKSAKKREKRLDRKSKLLEMAETLWHKLFAQFERRPGRGAYFGPMAKEMIAVMLSDQERGSFLIHRSNKSEQSYCVRVVSADGTFGTVPFSQKSDGFYHTPNGQVRGISMVDLIHRLPSSLGIDISKPVKVHDEDVFYADWRDFVWDSLKWTKLGGKLAKNGFPYTAMHVLEQARSLPGFASPLYTLELACVYKDLGKTQQAMRVLQDAYELDPSSAAIRATKKLWTTKCVSFEEMFLELDMYERIVSRAYRLAVFCEKFEPDDLQCTLILQRLVDKGVYRPDSFFYQSLGRCHLSVWIRTQCSSNLLLAAKALESALTFPKEQWEGDTLRKLSTAYFHLCKYVKCTKTLQMLRESEIQEKDFGGLLKMLEVAALVAQGSHEVAFALLMRLLRVQSDLVYTKPLRNCKEDGCLTSLRSKLHSALSEVDTFEILLLAGSLLQGSSVSLPRASNVADAIFDKAFALYTIHKSKTSKLLSQAREGSLFQAGRQQQRHQPSTAEDTKYPQSSFEQTFIEDRSEITEILHDKSSSRIDREQLASHDHLQVSDAADPGRSLGQASTSQPTVSLQGSDDAVLEELAETATSQTKALAKTGAPPRTLRLTIMRACDLPIADITTSDPFVRIHLFGNTRRTQVKYHTLNPVWMESFCFPCRNGDGVVALEVYDQDKDGEEFLGETCVRLQRFESGEERVLWLPLREKGWNESFASTGLSRRGRNKTKKEQERKRSMVAAAGCGSIQLRVKWEFDGMDETQLRDLQRSSARFQPRDIRATLEHMSTLTGPARHWVSDPAVWEQAAWTWRRCGLFPLFVHMLRCCLRAYSVCIKPVASESVSQRRRREKQRDDDRIRVLKLMLRELEMNGWERERAEVESQLRQHEDERQRRKDERYYFSDSDSDTEEAQSLVEKTDAGGTEDSTTADLACSNTVNPRTARTSEKTHPSKDYNQEVIRYYISPWTTAGRYAACGAPLYTNIETGETLTQLPPGVELEESLYPSDNTLIVARNVLQCRLVKFNKSVLHCWHEAKQRHLCDPHRWVEEFDDQSQQLSFYSPILNKRTKSQPQQYAMMASVFCIGVIIHLQRTFRERRRKRQETYRTKTVLTNFCWATGSFVAGGIRTVKRREEAARQAARLREIEQKSRLNKLVLAVIQARGLRIADILSSDPFVEVTYQEQSRVSSIVYRTLQPCWAELFSLDVQWTEHFGDELTVKVSDYDAPGKSDFLGMVKVPLRLLDHGRSVRRWISLGDEEGVDDSPRPRGDIELEIQWVNEREYPDLLCQIEEDDFARFSQEMFSAKWDKVKATIDHSASEESSDEEEFTNVALPELVLPAPKQIARPLLGHGQSKALEKAVDSFLSALTSFDQLSAVITQIWRLHSNFESSLINATMDQANVCRMRMKSALDTMYVGAKKRLTELWDGFAVDEKTFFNLVGEVQMMYENELDMLGYEHDLEVKAAKAKHRELLLHLSSNHREIVRRREAKLQRKEARALRRHKKEQIVFKNFCERHKKAKRLLKYRRKYRQSRGLGIDLVPDAEGEPSSEEDEEVSNLASLAPLRRRRNVKLRSVARASLLGTSSSPSSPLHNVSAKLVSANANTGMAIARRDRRNGMQDSTSLLGVGKADGPRFKITDDLSMKPDDYNKRQNLRGPNIVSTGTRPKNKSWKILRALRTPITSNRSRSQRRAAPTIAGESAEGASNYATAANAISRGRWRKVQVLRPTVLNSSRPKASDASKLDQYSKSKVQEYAEAIERCRDFLLEMKYQIIDSHRRIVKVIGYFEKSLEIEQQIHRIAKRVAAIPSDEDLGKRVAAEVEVKEVKNRLREQRAKNVQKRIEKRRKKHKR